MNSVLITGASRGIGLEMVKQYAQDSWIVYACCRNPEKANLLTAIKQDYPENIRIHQLDVTNEEQISSLSRSLQDISIDILINNAGIWGPINAHLNNIDIDSWLSVFTTNAIAPLIVTRAFIPQLLQGKRKIVAAISSIMGSIANNTEGSEYIYRSSKSALNSVFKNLSIDLRGKGITAVMLHPGWVKTDMGGSDALLKPEESVMQLRQILESVTLKDTGSFISYDGSQLQW